ncbi:MAG TPA: DUF4388 domain-containing protein [Vicinamibacteria bacterium]|nr:DUF4388 domain-containing protein [Vicinamibacteria bacterium]
MALEGTIKDFGLPDIFQLIGLQRKTGVLTLKNESEQVTVAFENGMVVMADSDSKRLEDRLGNVLVKQGKLSKDRLDEALVTQKATLQRLGHVLTSSNAITSRDLKEALQVQVSQIVFKVFRWRDGDYHFEPTDSVDYDRENFTPMSADFILMEGIRMVDEWPIIEKKIPSFDMVFRPVVDQTMVEVAPEGGDGVRLAPGASSKIRLAPQEEQIFRRVDGTRTVQAIIDSAGLNEFDTCRILFDLLNRNLISTAGRSAAAVEPVRAAVVPSRTQGYVGMAVVAVLALAGVWMNRHDPFGVTGLSAALDRPYYQLLDGVSQSRLNRLDQAVRAYHLVHGQLPRTLEELVGAGLADTRDLRDAWARPFHYALTVDGYLLSGVDDAGKEDPSTVIERVVPSAQ